MVQKPGLAMLSATGLTSSKAGAGHLLRATGGATGGPARSPTYLSPPYLAQSVSWLATGLPREPASRQCTLSPVWPGSTGLDAITNSGNLEMTPDLEGEEACFEPAPTASLHGAAEGLASIADDELDAGGLRIGHHRRQRENPDSEREFSGESDDGGKHAGRGFAVLPPWGIFPVVAGASEARVCAGGVSRTEPAFRLACPASAVEVFCWLPQRTDPAVFLVSTISGAAAETFAIVLPTSLLAPELGASKGRTSLAGGAVSPLCLRPLLFPEHTCNCKTTTPSRRPP